MPTRTSSRSWSAASLTSCSKSSWMRCEVSAPTAIAKPQRMTSVRSAEPPASRQRIGIRLCAEDVARAADRMKESSFTARFQLASQVGYEDLDRVGRRERIVTPDLLQEADRKSVV